MLNMKNLVLRAGFALALVGGLASNVNAQNDSSRGKSPGKPTSVEMLAEFGFDDSPGGLASALQSKDAFAKLYALKVLQEKKDSSQLARASELLKDDFIKVQIEAAKLLAICNQEAGWTWLRACESRMTGSADVPDDTAHVVLEAAGFLAQHSDYRLAKHVKTLFGHKHWAVRFTAARVLGDFTDVAAPGVDAMWQSAVDSLKLALAAKTAPADADVHLYLRWIEISTLKAPFSNPAIVLKMGELAAIDHSASAAIRKAIHEAWLAKPVAAARDPKNPAKAANSGK